MFQPACRPILIGSLPLADHRQAMDLIAEHSPEIPLWPQLPKLPGEGMVRQFLDGLPGLCDQGGKTFIASDETGFPAEMAAFYGDALSLESAAPALIPKRFHLSPTTARGFFTFLDYLSHRPAASFAVKGQITGAVTVGIGVSDAHGQPILHDDNLRDMLVRLLAAKAAWQVGQLAPFSAGVQPIIFVDEPGLVSFGSSGFAGVSRDTAIETTTALLAAIKAAGGNAGLHICANGDWGPALSSPADIISFDAYSYFDNFLLYRRELCAFLARGGVLAWGIIPTGDPKAVAEESAQALFQRWLTQLHNLAAFGFSEQQLAAQTLIAPSCGTGSLSRELAEKVLVMTAATSRLARSHFFR
jgi:hypothetical protein